MATRGVVAIGGSAGSIGAVKAIGCLRSDFPAARAKLWTLGHPTFRTWGSWSFTCLPGAGAMLVVQASEGAPIRKGTVYAG